MKYWMKKLSAAVLGLIFVMTTVPTVSVLAAEKEQRAVWISTVYRADYPTAQNDAAAQKAEFIQKLDAVKKMGINTAVVQIRPKADALYQSDLNPWSAVLTGTQGKNPGFDPMAFMIEETHKRGMEFHAWMNPYRITTSGTDLASLAPNHPARKHPDWILTYKGAMYFNPAKEEVKQYIVESVGEVVKKYQVDAIHFDDYFYPSNYPLKEGEDRNGAEANARRNHVNDLIERVHKEVKRINPKVKFGISPMGIWKNKTSDPSGSATKGAEGYYSVYGDAVTWIKKGWVDYIVPQIYWEPGYKSADYETLVKWWNGVVEGTDVDLYIGQGIYRDPVASQITKELQINEKYQNVDGSFYFSLRDLLQNRQGAATAIQKYYQEKDKGNLPIKPVTPSEKPEQPAKPVAPPTKQEQPVKSETPPANPQKPAKPQKPSVGNKQAYASKAQLTIDGKPREMDVYIIDDYSYFKLRDIAYAVTGTKKQFDTVWIEKDAAIHLQTGIPYTINGKEGNQGTGKDALALASTATLFVNGKPQKVSAFTINDYTYYKLRDVGKLVDFNVTWDEASFTIGVDTTKGYEK